MTSGAPTASTQNLTQSLAYVRDVMGRRLEDISSSHVFRCGVPGNVAPRYTALHKVYIRCGVWPRGGGCDDGHGMHHAWGPDNDF
jgi:hypothetical protein